ncbi:MAG: hypothetical protein JWQ73_2594 [Variovorax sp.]|nr:hypothetical protein [Variovorax sp.]
MARAGLRDPFGFRCARAEHAEPLISELRCSGISPADTLPVPSALRKVSTRRERASPRLRFCKGQMLAAPCAVTLDSVRSDTAVTSAKPDLPERHGAQSLRRTSDVARGKAVASEAANRGREIESLSRASGCLQFTSSNRREAGINSWRDRQSSLHEAPKTSARRRSPRLRFQETLFLSCRRTGMRRSNLNAGTLDRINIAPSSVHVFRFNVLPRS